MSTNTKLSIKSKDPYNKNVTDTINYVNPNISRNTALELAQKINALTNNSYQQTEKIETTELDSMIPKAQRPITAFKFQRGNVYEEVPADGIINIAASAITNNSIRFQITTPYDGTAPMIQDYTDTPVNPQATVTQLSSITWTGPAGLNDRRNLWQIQYQCDLNSTIAITPRSISFTVAFIETEQYESLARAITLNVTEG